MLNLPSTVEETLSFTAVEPFLPPPVVVVGESSASDAAVFVASGDAAPPVLDDWLLAFVEVFVGGSGTVFSAFPLVDDVAGVNVASFCLPVVVETWFEGVVLEGIELRGGYSKCLKWRRADGTYGTALAESSGLEMVRVGWREIKDWFDVNTEDGIGWEPVEESEREFAD